MLDDGDNKKRKRKQRKFRNACGRKKEIENRDNRKSVYQWGEKWERRRKKKKKKEIKYKYKHELKIKAKFERQNEVGKEKVNIKKKEMKDRR